MPQDYRTDHWFAQRRRRGKGLNQIDNLVGYSVQELTPYQFRIDGVLDLYPTSRAYHYIPKKQRGYYESAQEICDKLLKERSS